MTKDISEKLRAAAVRRNTWSEDRLSSVLQEAILTFPLIILDWEPGDEYWASLQMERGASVAILRADAPLAITLRSAGPAAAIGTFLWELGLVVIEASDWNAEELRIDDLSARDAVGLKWTYDHDVIDPHRFSVGALWYVTIGGE